MQCRNAETEMKKRCIRNCRLKVNFPPDLSWDKKQSTLFLEEYTHWEWVQMPKLKQIERVMLLMRGEYWTVYKCWCVVAFQKHLTEIHFSMTRSAALPSPRRRDAYIIIYFQSSAKETPINRRSVHIYMCIVSAPVCLCIICPMNRRWLRQTPSPGANIYVYCCIV
jgi:hypothetical protein